MSVMRHAAAILGLLALIGAIVTVVDLIMVFTNAPVPRAAFTELHHWFQEDVFHLALIVLAMAGAERLARK